MKTDHASHYFNSAGWPFMALFGLVTFVFSLFSGFLFCIGLILTAWCCYFFRDPQRVTPVKTGLIVSPADGRVVAVQEIIPDAGLNLGDERRVRISIFLNVFDVHVNRIPADGVVRHRYYRPGKFFNASLDKASVDNERMSLTMQLTGDHPYNGRTMGVVQIAGLVARRIVCSAQEGQTFKAGERFGIIRFGSRADIYLPNGMAATVCVGQYMIGGETVIADCNSTEGFRQGETRL